MFFICTRVLCVRMCHSAIRVRMPRVEHQYTCEHVVVRGRTVQVGIRVHCANVLQWHCTGTLALHWQVTDIVMRCAVQVHCTVPQNMGLLIWNGFRVTPSLAADPSCELYWK